MPVPSAWTDISENASLNSPAGSETVGPNMNAYLQAAYAYCRQLYDGQIKPLAALNFNGQQINNIAAGVAGTDAANMSNLGAYLLIAGGQTVTGSVTITPAAPANVGLTINSNNIGALTVSAPASATGASVSLFDVGTNTKKYLSCVNGTFSIINNAHSLVCMSVDDSGNLIALGNITSSSDARFKQDWSNLDSDFITKLSKIKSGTYTDKRSKERRVGVTAQSLRKLLPEAVSSDGKGLSVAYGQAALVAAVELAREVIELRKRLAKLEKGQ